MTEARNDGAEEEAPNYHTFTGQRDLLSDVEQNAKVDRDTKVIFKTHQLHFDVDQSPPTVFQRLWPSVLVLCSSVLLSTSQSAVRYTTVSFGTSPLFLAFFRGVLQTLFSASAIFVFRSSTLATPLDRKSIFMVSLRGFMGSCAIVMKFFSLTRLPVAVATSLFSTTPLFASLFSWMFLREGLHGSDKLALVITTAATLLVGMSPSDTVPVVEATFGVSHILGVVFALLAAMSSGSAFVIIRAMGVRVHFLFSVFTLGINVLLSPIFLSLLETGDIRKTTTFFLHTFLYSERGAYVGFLSVAGFAIAGALCLNRGAQLTAPGRVAMLRTFDIPIGFFVAFLLLGEFPRSTAQLAGCAMIAASTFLVAFKRSS